MDILVRGLVAVTFVIAAFVASPAQASFHLFQIEQVYSDSDGEVQYVVLREASGANGENLWAGQVLVSQNAAGVTKSVSFPVNLPSSATANRSVLIATPGFAALGLLAPDYLMPARFVPTAGGSLDYGSGSDRVTLPPLPTDGATAVMRTGALVAAIPQNFGGATANVASRAVTSVEFYNAGLDHYFMSSLAPDIDALDSGRIAGWTRTGQTFGVFPAQGPATSATSPVCRILIPPPANSHFFSASPQECADTLTKFPFMIEETPSAFFIALPTTSGPAAGACPAGTVPVHRVFNNRPDGNHRYTTDPVTRDVMVAGGGTAEGYGTDAVIMCAPPAGAAAAAAPGPGPMPPPPDFGPGYGYGPP